MARPRVVKATNRAGMTPRRIVTSGFVGSRRCGSYAGPARRTMYFCVIVTVPSIARACPLHWCSQPQWRGVRSLHFLASTVAGPGRAYRPPCRRALQASAVSQHSESPDRVKRLLEEFQPLRQHPVAGMCDWSGRGRLKIEVGPPLLSTSAVLVALERSSALLRPELWRRATFISRGKRCRRSGHRNR